MTTNKVVANALKARVVTNKSRKVTEKISKAFLSVQDALAQLQYAKHIITIEESGAQGSELIDIVSLIE